MRKILTVAATLMTLAAVTAPTVAQAQYYGGYRGAYAYAPYYGGGYYGSRGNPSSRDALNTCSYC